MRFHPACRLLLLSLPCLAQEPELPAHQKLIPTLWVQTSVEWRAVATQSYELARLMLDRALRDKKSTAALEQQGNFRKLPPAVILDIDETILDNSPSQARQVRSGAGWDSAAWDTWVREGAAAPIPGAAEFCIYAASRGVTVFYVSNREASTEAATRANLQKYGFPLKDSLDTVLLAREKPEWQSDKTTRRADVASRYRILMLLGDDLNDFLSGVRTTVQKRDALVSAHKARWGRQWIMLPNPGYGSWEEAHYGEPRPTTAQGRLDRKLELIRTK